MVGFAKQRDLMVLNQILPSTVLDPALEAAVKNVAREKFLPADKQHMAYVDTSIRLDETHFMMRVLDLVEMIQALNVSAGDKALDVGCASGYSTFLLNYLVKEVVGFDETEKYLTQARGLVKEQGLQDLSFVCGPLSLGCPTPGPYDAILVQKALPHRPEVLLDQLAPAGRLTYIHQTESQYGRVHVLTRNNGTFSESIEFELRAPVFAGQQQGFVL